MYKNNVDNDFASSISPESTFASDSSSVSGSSVISSSSSPGSGACLRSVARNAYNRSVQNPGTVKNAPSGDSVPENPVSSCSSRPAHSAGSSPGSSPPAGNSSSS